MRENNIDYLPELDDLHRSFNDTQVKNRRIKKSTLLKNILFTEAKNGKDWSGFFFG